MNKVKKGKRVKLALHLLLLNLVVASPNLLAESTPIKVNVFIASMFEIGDNTGDKAGEFQYWYNSYFNAEKADQKQYQIPVVGAEKEVYCNSNGICGAVLGMGKVASASSMQAILLNERFDFSDAYFIFSGVAGTPPSKGTIGDVSIGTYVVDYDLGHRWASDEVKSGAPLFTPRNGYEAIRCYKMPEHLVSFAKKATEKMILADSPDAKAYRLRYPDKEARRAPKIIYGSHFTGDTFFHGPGLSNEAQYMSELYRVDDYVITEMEASGLMQVLVRHGFADKAISLRAAVNFDQGHPKESTLAHLDPAPGETAGGFDQALQNMHAVGLELINGLAKKPSALEVSLKKATATTDDSCTVDTELLIQPKDY
ncbi:hypothetical protein NBRC116591_39130 [Sessilibacter corallicola]|uniref:Purine nucleoside permease n=1 Tax=Sessilibacter corallicola TaxID=2904075 RepID=A0ABQ0AEM0_9GAMM